MKETGNETQTNGAGRSTVNQNPKGNGRKRTTGMLAAVLALVLLMSGTFAWYYMANAVNEFSNIVEWDSSAVLHDDFQKESDTGVHNKDVYVENTGEGYIYVRLRLDEYMEINGTSLIGGAQKGDQSTWQTHIPHEDDPADPGSTDDPFHDYWEWQMGGQTVYAPSAAGSNGVESRYDATGRDTLPATGTETTLNASVITMAEYTNKSDTDKAAFVGWVYDTDGYAYWSQKLQPGEATGLLLDQVTMKGSFSNGSEYYYAINVVMETVDRDDLDAWINGTATTTGEIPDRAGAYAADMLLTIASEFNIDAQGKISRIDAGGSVILSDREWIILSKDDTAGTAELLSMNIVASRRRDTEYKVQNGGEGGWENSDLRAWMNGTGDYENGIGSKYASEGNFYDDMLGDDIKDILVETTKITNKPLVDYRDVDETDFDNFDSDVAQLTEDNVYLLSVKEYVAYEAAYSGNLYAAGVDSGVSIDHWWLRTPYTSETTVITINRTNGNYGRHSVLNYYGVRPALTVNYK